jgi:hypothetical protein
VPVLQYLAILTKDLASLCRWSGLLRFIIALFFWPVGQVFFTHEYIFLSAIHAHTNPMASELHTGVHFPLLGSWTLHTILLMGNYNCSRSIGLCISKFQLEIQPAVYASGQAHGLGLLLQRIILAFFRRPAEMYYFHTLANFQFSNNDSLIPLS